MKPYIVLLALTLFCCSCKQKEEDVLASIKKHVTEINGKLKEYKSRQVDDITHPGGGSITGYYRDKEVKKVLAEHYSDSSRTFIEYYFDDGMLIMVYEQLFVYNKPVSYTEEKARANNDSVWYDDKKTRMLESWCYFHENKLIKWVSPENVEIPGSSDFTDKEPQVLAETIILLKQLKED